MPSEITRMDVNAAIERLIMRSEDSEHAARIVIRYGDKLRSSWPFQYSSTKTTTRSDAASGYAPGVGNVTVKSEQSEEQTEYVFGVYKDRIGYYRLWKQGEGLLCFHHFWKSGLTTRGQGSDPETYRLGYDPESLEPEFLGVERVRVILRIGAFEFFRVYLEPVLGTIKKPLRGYGLKFSITR